MVSLSERRFLLSILASSEMNPTNGIRLEIGSGYENSVWAGKRGITLVRVDL